MECYSLSINSSGTKLALGGLDGKVCIWDVASILRYKDHATLEDAQSRNLLDRLNLHTLAYILRPLASVSRHNGVVASVKFSPNGRFLASGSDDKIVLIWEKDEDLQNRPKQFGEAEPDLEHWTVRKRLVAHDNDVQDICWSPDGSLLITVGLDRSIIIWSGTTFERIKRYDIHQLMVKGVVFDPANKFFATASDDRTVRIFRFYRKHDGLGSYEFQMEQIVYEPFLKLPLTSYFRRMSWSPDGQHIAIPNATNGPVTSVVVVNRGNWASDVSLIGHEAPCEVCAFSPRLFRVKDSNDYTTILASAGQDRSVAVWSTSLLKPLVVLHDVALRAITDMCWTPDGQTLFFSSLDGLITCIAFDENELGEIVSDDAINTQLLQYGGDQDSKIMPEGVSQLRLEALAKNLDKPQKESTNIPQEVIPTPHMSTPPRKESPAPATSAQLNTKSEKVTFNTATVKGGKKRVAPTLVSKYTPLQATASKVVKIKKFDISSKLSQTSYFLPRLGIQAAVNGLSLRLAHIDKDKNGDDNDNDNEDMGIDDPSNQLQAQSSVGTRTKFKKYRKYLMLHKYPTPFRFISSLPTAFFSNQAVMSHEISRMMLNKELIRLNNELVNTSSLDALDENIYFQVVASSIEHVKSDFNDAITPSKESSVISTVEIRNGPMWPEDEDLANLDFAQRLDFQDPTQVSVANNDNSTKKEYMLYFPYRIQQVIPILNEGLLSHYVFVSFDGTIQIVRAKTGSYVCPGLELGSNVVAWRQKNNYLLLLTSAGLLYCWKLSANKIIGRELTKVLSGVSVAAVLNAETVSSRVEIDSKPEKIEKSEKEKDKEKEKEKEKLVKDEKEKKAEDKQTINQMVIDNIQAIDIDPSSGSPFIIIQRTNNIYSYSLELKAWTKTIDLWYFGALEEIDFTDMGAEDDRRRLLLKTYKENKEKVDRGEKSRYVFGVGNYELQNCMKERFMEQVSL